MAPRARAKRLTQGAVLEEYSLARARPPLKLGQLLLYQRRALGIALAALTTPPVLCLEAPLRNLDAASADYVARLCAHAAERSRLVISADLPSTANAEVCPARRVTTGCFCSRTPGRTWLLHGSAESVARTRVPRYLHDASSAQKESELVLALDAAGCQPRKTAESDHVSAPCCAPNSRVTRYLVELPEAASSGRCSMPRSTRA